MLNSEVRKKQKILGRKVNKDQRPHAVGTNRESTDEIYGHWKCLQSDSHGDVLMAQGAQSELSDNQGWGMGGGGGFKSQGHRVF